MDSSDWNSPQTARNDGRLCKLLVEKDNCVLELEDEHYFSSDGHWYRLRPPKRLDVQPLYWRPI